MDCNRNRRYGYRHRRQSKERGYGIQQSEIAEKQTQLNLSAPIHNGCQSEQDSHLEWTREKQSARIYDLVVYVSSLTLTEKTGTGRTSQGIVKPALLLGLS